MIIVIDGGSGGDPIVQKYPMNEKGYGHGMVMRVSNEELWRETINANSKSR